MTRRLRTRNPTTRPIATAPPVFSPPASVDVEFTITFVPLVDLAVGFSVGMEGNGEEFGLLAAVELL